MPTHVKRLLRILLYVYLATACSGAEPTILEKRDYGIQRALVHWSGYDDPGYLDWAGEAKVQFMQVGFFGPILHSMANAKGRENWHYIPREGIQANYDYYRDFIRRAHAKGIKVNGHFSMSYLFGDPAEGKERGWFDFVKHRWDERALGPRPSADPFDYLQRYGDGRPITMSAKEDERLKGLDYLSKYWGCPNNPNWQAALEGMVKNAIGLGLDGITALYSYRLSCACPHCVRGFREHLKARFTPEQIRERFGIDDLGSYAPMEIPPAKTGTTQNEALRAEGQIFSQRSQKRLVNQVLIGYGRRLKPDFQVAVWRHFYNEGHTDEEQFLPSAEYSKDESYIWFCMGGAASITKLAERVAGDSTITAKYAGRIMAGKPILMNKYDQTRIRLSIAEAASLAGMAVPRLRAFDHPLDRAVISQYFQFLDANKDLFYPSQTYAEIALAYSRRAKSLVDDAFERPMFSIARQLVENHYLFDIVVDDLLTPEELARYKVLILPETRYFDKSLTATVERFVERGGRVLVTGETGAYDERGSKLAANALSLLRTGKGRGKNWDRLESFDAAALERALESMAPRRLSRLHGPWSTEIQAYEQARARRAVVHLVNYNRDERPAPAAPVARWSAGGRMQGGCLQCHEEAVAFAPSEPAMAEKEKPIPVENVRVSLNLPPNARVKEVRFLTPERGAPESLRYVQKGGVLEFTAPKFLVYGVCAIQY